jgi:hypothetical protein
LKERGESRPTGAISAFLTAITLLGVIGLGIMLGGALVLRREAQLGEDLVGIFMFFTFLIVATTEILLVRQLSRLTSSSDKSQFVNPPPRPIPNELQAQPARALAEPIPSVTENTTRTLEYSRNEPAR